ncbi:MAG: sigma-70 family RNA polymerase sigma factor [Planctomycetota bacterium]
MDHPHPEALLAHDHFVRALSRRLLGDAHDAEDAVQQTWLAALEHPSQSGAPLRAWLAKVLRNFVRRGHRSAERRLARELRAARPSGVPSPSEIAEREAARRSVLAAVLALAEPFRDAILLRFYDNCKPHAAARQLGIPVETFRTRVKRGLELLRCELEREYGSTRRWSMALLPLAAVPPATPEPRMISSLLEEGAPAMNIVPKLAVVLLAAGIMSGLWHLLPRPAPNHADPPPRANQAQQPNAALAGGPPAARAVVEAAPAPLPSSAGRKEPVGGGDTGAVAVQALFDDGSPAYPLGIELVEWATPQYSLHKRYAPTDASGACRFEGVAAGRVHVMYDRSPGGDGVDVVAGAEARVALRLPRFAWSVRGEVVDAGGQPVPGAEIWFAGCDRQGQVITTADALGRFEIRHVERISFLAARAPGREPSPAAASTRAGARSGPADPATPDDRRRRLAPRGSRARARRRRDRRRGRADRQRG